MSSYHAPVESYRDELYDFCGSMYSQFSWEDGRWLLDHQLFPVVTFFFFVLIAFHPTLLLSLSLKKMYFFIK